MNNLVRTFLFSIIILIAVQFSLDAKETDKSPFKGEWIKINERGLESTLKFESDPNSDLFGSYIEEDRDGEYCQLKKSNIISRGDNTITFTDVFDRRITLTYIPQYKCITVAIDEKIVATYPEDTCKIQYMYVAMDADFMSDPNSNSVTGKVKAGNRYNFSDIIERKDVFTYIRRPFDTNGWMYTYVLSPGVTQPIISDTFPVKWEYDDGRAGYSLTFRKMDDKNILAIYQWQAYMGENATTNCGSIAYLGTIDGNRMAFRKQKNPANGNSGFTIMQKPIEMTLLPGNFMYGASDERLIFDGMRFSPVFDND